ncbi:MAG: hypothetical protein AAGE93_15025 [Bacteroidota bacterium]
MDKNTKNAVNLQPDPSPPSEAEIRRRITNLIEAGGVYPITITGVRNLAKVMRISREEVTRIIREQTLELAGREVQHG